MKRLSDWAIYLIFIIGIILVILPFQEYLTERFSPKRNYQRGLLDGMENAEYYCNSFSPDYIGSLDYIRRNDQKLYKELINEKQ